MWQEKLGNYLLDVSKYIFTAVLIASLLKDFEDLRWLVYLLGATSSALFLAIGLYLTNRNNHKNKDKQ